MKMVRTWALESGSLWTVMVLWSLLRPLGNTILSGISDFPVQGTMQCRSDGNMLAMQSSVKSPATILLLNTESIRSRKY